MVGGKSNERGVVSAASYAARKFGVHSAMPLRRAYQLCPQAIFVEGHMERYRHYSGRVFEILNRLHAPGQHGFHRRSVSRYDRHRTLCTVRIPARRPPASRSHQAGHRPLTVPSEFPRPAWWRKSLPIRRNRMAFSGLSPAGKPPSSRHSMSAKSPVSAKSPNRICISLGIRKVGDMAALDESFLESRFGAWGLAMAGKAQGRDAGAWFDHAIGESSDPKSVSHEHTFSIDTADRDQLESTVAHLAERVAPPPSRALPLGPAPSN